VYRFKPPNIIVRVADGKEILPDSSNADYIAYQVWIAAGNLAQAHSLDPSWSWGADFGTVIGGQPTGGTNVG
jgi:hypothetical protein